VDHNESNVDAGGIVDCAYFTSINLPYNDAKQKGIRIIDPRMNQRPVASSASHLPEEYTRENSCHGLR
jgi:hypothetical protein